MSRPYQPDFAARVVALAADGLSRAEIAVALGATLTDFDAWATQHEPFAAALDEADTLARAWWDRQPREAMASGKSFRISLWAKVMAQRYGRSGHSPRTAPGKPPPVRARYELPDNGTSRRRGGEGGGRAQGGKSEG